MLIDEMNHIGFTGTREGMNPQQIDLMILFLRMLQYTMIKKQRIETDITFHHGMCIGSDEGFHHLIRSIMPRAVIIGHPPIDKKLMMADIDQNRCDELREPKDYIIRNHDIVNESQIVISTPEGPEIQRSGTWSTIRYARKTRTPLLILE